MTRTFVDVGCGEGVVLERWALNCRQAADIDVMRLYMVGIESDIDLAQYAAPYCDRLITGDASTFDYSTLPQPLLLWLFNTQLQVHKW
jgi:hypothetical protein